MCNGGYNTASTVYLTSVNDDDKIDYAVVIPAQVAKVTYAAATDFERDVGNIVHNLKIPSIYLERH